MDHAGGGGYWSIQKLDLLFGDVVRVQSAIIISSCSGCVDSLNLLADRTSLLLIGPTLPGLGVVVRWLLRRRAVSGP